MRTKTEKEISLIDQEIGVRKFIVAIKESGELSASDTLFIFKMAEEFINEEKETV